MNSNQFITKQQIKYLWKNIWRDKYVTGDAYRSLDGKTADSYWDYEPMTTEV